MLKVGLTGGIGSGKSSAVRRFQALGAKIIDADAVAREVVAPGEPALEAIVKAFGPDVLDSDAQLDRAWLRQRVFNDAEARVRLEAITHPAIRQRLLAAMNEADSSAYLLADIPLLVEQNYQDLFDAVIVVDCAPEQQLQRAAARDGSDVALIKRIMASQVSRDERLRHATHVLDNSTSLDDLYQQIEALHQQLLALAAQD
ncbi:MAG: dephospho-CoA kinase [Thiolinea sp.]